MKICLVMPDIHGMFGDDDPSQRGTWSRASRIGIECKRADAPKLTPSMRTAMIDLKLDRLIVAYPGTRRYPLANRIEVVPLADLIG